MLHLTLTFMEAQAFLYQLLSGYGCLINGCFWGFFLSGRFI